MKDGNESKSLRAMAVDVGKVFMAVAAYAAVVVFVGSAFGMAWAVGILAVVQGFNVAHNRATDAWERTMEHGLVTIMERLPGPGVMQQKPILSASPEQLRALQDLADPRRLRVGP